MIDGTMQGIVNRNLLRFAVGQAMFCPSCRKSLDYRKAVLISLPDRHEMVACGTCWDHLKTRLSDQKLAALEVIDGRAK